MKNIKLLIIAILLPMMLFAVPGIAKEYDVSDYDIVLTLQESGDYLITERITFNFKEGTFSWVSRNIKGRGFDELQFKSITGINTHITDYEVDQGNDLNVKWYFSETEGLKTFAIKYLARGGLITRGDKNVIDWLAVGKEWQVPVNDVDVTIKLPQRVEKLNISPRADVVVQTDNEINFHKNSLKAGEAYRITLDFPLLIKTDRNTTPVSTGLPEGMGIIVLVSLIAGLILGVIDILKRQKPEARASNINIDGLSFARQAVLYASGNQNRSGVASQLFKLAREGKIKLISKVKKGFMGSKKAEIEVDILSEEDLLPEDKIIINKLQKHKLLKKFARDNKVFRQVHDSVVNSLQEMELISVKALSRRKRIYFSSLFLFLPGIAALIYGGISGFLLIIGLGLFLLVMGISRLIKGGITPVLSGEGVYLKEKLQDTVDRKKDKLDKLVKAEKADETLHYFLAQIEYLLIHKKFTSSTMKKYKKVFKKAEDIEIPDWIEFDLADLDETIEALDIVEIIDYMMISILVITASTGATPGATGGGGGAAGGGGGAAG